MTADLSHAFRWLRKNPLFTAAITSILVLGIGANTAVFSVVDAVLLRGAPYRSDRLIRIEESSTKHVMNGIPAQDYLFWRGRADLFEKTAAFTKDFVTLTGAGDPDQVRALRVSAGLFPMLDVRARLGRTLAESDGDFNAPNIAVLSDRLWRRRFAANPAAIGRSITVSGELFTIAGVMPPDFSFSSTDIDLWLPLRLTPAYTGNVQAVARIQPGLSVAQVQSAMQIVMRQLIARDPRRDGLEIAVTPWREVVERQYELTLVFVLVAVGLVLLIACADAGSLLLSRAMQRQKEIAIRASLGAGFWRVARQLLVESLLLTVLGSAAGIALARYLLSFLYRQLAALPITLPNLQRVALNERALLFSVGLCIVLACLISGAPLVFASRVDLQPALRGTQATGGSKRSTRLFSLLIAAEAAFAFLLLVGSGLMIRSLVRLQQADHGFHPDHVLTMRVPIGTLTQPRPTGQFETKPRQMAYYHELIERLSATHGVDAIAVVNNLPLSGVNTSVAMPGPAGQPLLNTTRTISSQYFAVMGIPLLEGRTFTAADGANSPRVAIVNQFLARQLFPDRDAVGQPLPVESPNDPRTIVVGVVKDSSQNKYDQPAKGELYLPYQQTIFGVFMSTIVVRTSSDPLQLAATLSREVWKINPEQPIVNVRTMNDVIAESIWRPRFSAWIFAVLGGLALLLTCAGVYSVVAYTTTLRFREIGVRVALGATPRDVIAVVLKSAMGPLFAGLAVSLFAALLLSRVLTSLLYQIATTDPLTYLLAASILLLIGGLASARPAWKAATGDPLQALRME